MCSLVEGDVSALEAISFWPQVKNSIKRPFAVWLPPRGLGSDGSINTPIKAACLQTEVNYPAAPLNESSGALIKTTYLPIRCFIAERNKLFL